MGGGDIAAGDSGAGGLEDGPGGDPAKECCTQAMRSCTLNCCPGCMMLVYNQVVRTRQEICTCKKLCAAMHAVSSCSLAQVPVLSTCMQAGAD